MKRVTIVGSGFAALTAVKTLRSKSPELDITLVSPKAEFHYYPGSIWIPSGLREPEDLIIPLGNFLHRMRVTHVAAEATGLSENGRTLITSAGEIENDGLIICSGGRFIKKLPGIEHAITPCEGIAATMRIRERLKALQGGTIAMPKLPEPKISPKTARIRAQIRPRHRVCYLMKVGTIAVLGRVCESARSVSQLACTNTVCFHLRKEQIMKANL